jgi:hypothetical protein
MHPGLRALWAIALLLAGGADPLVSLMPGDGVMPGWQRKGEALLFAGAELYRHIDGGAELYQRHGFVRLAVQDYARVALELRAEIYLMDGPAGAAAVFAELAEGLETGRNYGTACVLDDYQVLFQRGAYCVALTAYESGPETRAALAALAAKIDESLVALAL